MRWKRIAAPFVISVGLLWLCTGGCVVHSYWLLPSDSHGREFRPYLRADVTRRPAVYGVPLIFQYVTDRSPFGLRMTFITHTVVADPTLTFDRVAVEYPNGSVTDLTDRFRSAVVPHPAEHWYIDDDGRDQKRPSLRWEAVIEGVLPRATPFELRVKGQLRSGGKVIEEFDFVLRIQLRYETTTRTGWASLVEE